MSPHIIELLIFAAVAFFLINKLLSVLGTTTKEEQARFKDSIFGEPGILKDVTAKVEDMKYIASDMFNNLLVQENKVSILENLQIITHRMPNFDLTRFVQNAKAAYDMLLKALKTNDTKTIEQLVDKRFIKSFIVMTDKYESIIDSSLLDAKVSELYMFGHNVFVKILFTAASSPQEEWTFTKNTQSKGPDWFLSSITTA